MMITVEQWHSHPFHLIAPLQAPPQQEHAPLVLLYGASYIGRIPLQFLHIDDDDDDDDDDDRERV